MTVNKIEILDRLRADGRWPEAAKRRDQLIAQFRKAGMKRGEASEEAWRRLAEQFPPLEVGDDDAEAECPLPVVEDGDAPPNLVRDVE
jgi:hypothetical protein